MKRNMKDFDELPTQSDLLYSSISTLSGSGMQDLVNKVVEGSDISDPIMVEQLRIYTKMQFRLGKLNDGNYAVINTIEGDEVEVYTEFTKSQYESLVNFVANEVIMNVLSEIQFQQYDFSSGSPHE